MDSAERLSTVADIVRHHGRNRPDRVALYFEGQSVSYGDLDRRASRVAQGLIAAGVKPRTRIAILAKNDLAFFELWFGATKAGAVLVPVNFRLAPVEIAYVVNDAQAEFLFVGRDFYPVIEKVRGGTRERAPHRRAAWRASGMAGLCRLGRSTGAARSGFADRRRRRRHPDVYQRHHRPPQGSAAQPHQSARLDAHRDHAGGPLA